jgi:alpha-galactosidase
MRTIAAACLLALTPVLVPVLAAQTPTPAPTLATTSPVTLAATPPMGWNSWNHFAEKVTDADVRAAADALVSTGMKDAGYIYVNIDDTWEGKRDAHGVLYTNQKFPDMKALADYVHGKGLKLGIYSSPGPYTCAHYAGSYKHERQDAQLYAKWGIDYLKYDMCSFNNIMEKQIGKAGPTTNARRYAMERAAYEKMHRELLAAGARTGRPIVFSFCQYGWDDVWKWGADAGGNLWRTTGDINDTYARMSEIGFGQAGLAKYAGPGHWNDPDMLEVGNGGMTEDEYRTHMTLWAILAAPLLAGNDLSKMTPETLAILTNKDVVAIDQDALGTQGDRLSAEGSSEIWSRPLAGGGKAIAFFNRSSAPEPITLHLDQAGVAQLNLHDVWADRDVLPVEGAYTATVPAHGTVLLRASVAP